MTHEEPLTEKDFAPGIKMFQALADGEWHDYKELENKTNWSSATLAKHLNSSVTLSEIEKRIDPDDGRKTQYRILTKGLYELARQRDIKHIVDSTFGELPIPEGAIKKIIEKKKPLEDLYASLRKLWLDKETRFFLEEFEKENIEWMADSISIKHYVHGCAIYKGDLRVISVFVKYLLENMIPPTEFLYLFNKKPHEAVRDFLVVLSCIPKDEKEFENTEEFKQREHQRFMRWVNTFRSTNTMSKSVSAKGELFMEFRKKWDQYTEEFVKKSREES